MSRKELQIGDAVSLKKRKNMRPPRYSETPSQLGIGTVVEIMEGLFTYPHQNSVVFEYDSDLHPEYVFHKMKQDKTKEVINTSICKIFWHGIGKYRWEYETDLKNNPLDLKKQQDT